MAAHASTLAGRNPVDRGAWRATVRGVTKSQTRLTEQALMQMLKELQTFFRCFEELEYIYVPTSP